MRFIRRPKLRDADYSELRNSIDALRAMLFILGKEREMSSSTTPDLVSIDQNALNSFASEIAAAVAVLGPYIAKLLAGEGVTLQPADVSKVSAAIASLQNLEPPVTTVPVPTTPASTTPVSSSGNSSSAPGNVIH